MNRMKHYEMFTKFGRDNSSLVILFVYLFDNYFMIHLLFFLFLLVLFLQNLFVYVFQNTLNLLLNVLVLNQTSVFFYLMRSSLSLVELDYIFQYQKEDSFYQERFDYLFSFCCRVNSFQKFNLIIIMIKARLFQIKSLNSSSFTSCSLCARHFDLEFYHQ